MHPLSEPVTRPGPSIRPGVPAGAGTGSSPSTVLSGWFDVVGTGGDLQPRMLRLGDGRLIALPVARWAGPVDAADETLLSRARGPVLDVGCGPGRLTAALHRRGVDVLGLELVESIPVLVREAGAPLFLGDVYDTVPRSGQWQSIVLADGNVGIGGDPARLLTRLEELLAPGGTLLVELHPGADAPGGPVRLEGLGEASSWFPWALLGTSGLAAAARTAALDVSESWSARGRDFALLSRL